MSQSVNKISRYFKIPLVFLKTSAMSQLEYRFEFLTWTVTSLLYVFLSFAVVDLIFGQVTAVAGWSRDEVLLVVAVNAIFASLIWMFIMPSLETFMDNMRTGTIDYYLTKPINSRFLASVSKYDVDNITRVLFLMYYILFVIGVWHWGVSPTSFLSFLLMLAFGLIIIYNLLFMMTTATFWFIDLSNMSDLMDNVLGLGRYPTYIFENTLKFILFFIVPIAFTATFPVQFLIGKGDASLLVIGLILVIISFVISQKFWNFAVKRYSSASS